MKLGDRVVVVTGGGNGIGRALALELLKRGARVAAVDVSSAALSETARLAQSEERRLAVFTADISSRTAAAALPAAVASRLGPVDGLINCAGIIQPFVKVSALDDAAIERVFAVNWYGTLYMTRAFLPALQARPEAHLVNISSMGGLLPVPGQTVYGASKAAVKLFTEGLRSELMGGPVRVTVVFPGGVSTNIMANSGVSPPTAADQAQGRAKALSPEQAAREILDAVEANAGRVLIGKDAKMLDLFSRLAPERAAAFIAKQMKRLVAREEEK